MDLDLKNYSTDELLSILQVENLDPTVNILQKALLKKIDEIEKTKDELPESKDNLMSFYTRSFFRIINDKSLYETFHAPPANKFISVEEKLLPMLHESHIVSQNDNVVVKHKNDDPLPTWDTHLKAGSINPLKRKSFKKILNINTRFRENYQLTKSTDFIFTLPFPVKKVVSMKLGCTEFPKTVYTFSSNLGSNNFSIGTSDPLTRIDISNGSYSAAALINEINPLINPDASLNYNINTGKMTFVNDGGIPFDLNFDYDNQSSCPPPLPNIDKNQLTLGWMLGFRDGAILKPTTTPSGKFNRIRDKCCPDLKEIDISNTYIGESSYTGEAVFDGHGTRYFLLSVNDYQNNHNETFISPFKEQTLADNNILAKISTECCNDCCCENPERIYFGPMDLTKLNIKLFDEFGRLVDINNADYSFTLELELLYEL